MLSDQGTPAQSIRSRSPLAGSRMTRPVRTFPFLVRQSLGSRTSNAALPMRSSAIMRGLWPRCARRLVTGCLAGVCSLGRGRRRRSCGRSAKSLGTPSAWSVRLVRRSSTFSPLPRAGTMPCGQCSFGPNLWRGLVALQSMRCAGSTSATPVRGSSMRVTTGPCVRASVRCRSVGQGRRDAGHEPRTAVRCIIHCDPGE